MASEVTPVVMLTMSGAALTVPDAASEIVRLAGSAVADRGRDAARMASAGRAMRRAAARGIGVSRFFGLVLEFGAHKESVMRRNCELQQKPLKGEASIDGDVFAPDGVVWTIIRPLRIGGP
ncbi:hypothetical protein AUC68_11190 [Methyloceanibacter methanicus]|uniref:Uncharacterized protein n=1 Tax=Methyloceanibacter methanicus TaxID=1774968 RepID=A0A1E3VWZ8_9HYPH|nr:hypothetical protein AUC68_11190 [Methyloceanibacter methanicus]